MWANSVGGILGEFAGVELGDVRLERRLPLIVEKISAAPDQSLPHAIGDDSALEGAYRFMKNEKVTFDRLLRTHYLSTSERIAEARTVIVPHDTSEIDYSDSPVREGLGRLRGNGGRNDQGYLGHFAFAVAADSKRPLGLIGAKTWARTGPKTSKKANGVRRSGGDYAKMPNRESTRWAEVVDACEARVAGRARLIHVMDREADVFELLRHLADKFHFVVRVKQDRCVELETAPGEAQKLQEAIRSSKDYLEVEVKVSKRKGKTAPRHKKAVPAREARTATLRYSAMRLSFKKPRYVEGPEFLPVNVVWVHELNCPEGVEPVDWMLVTSEPIDTKEEVEKIVEYYRTRWIIEEFFKALKTGCAVEERQLETYHALLNMIALCVPIATQMLALRNLARNEPDAPASAVMSPTQLQVLRLVSRMPLDKDCPTARQALMAVAGLGGHLKRNGEPGWLTLARGMQKLVGYDAGYRLGLAQRDGPGDV